MSDGTAKSPSVDFLVTEEDDFQGSLSITGVQVENLTLFFRRFLNTAV
jgi:hypothetical protein